MPVSIELPENLELKLRGETEDLELFAKEAFAIEAFRAGKLSLGQFSELLGISHYEADGILKARGIELEQSDDELESERAALRNLLRR